MTGTGLCKGCKKLTSFYSQAHMAWLCDSTRCIGGASPRMTGRAVSPVIVPTDRPDIKPKPKSTLNRKQRRTIAAIIRKRTDE